MASPLVPPTGSARVGTLIYDADCGFCTRTARWAGRGRRGDAVAVAPWQSLDLAAVGLTERQTTEAAWWVDADGGTHRGHLAVGRALGARGGVGAVAGRLLSVPPVSWVASVVYRLVAQNRHLMPGGTDACRLDLPPPSDTGSDREPTPER